MKKKVLIVCLIVAVLAAATITVFAAGYDSSSDPLVTLSYITDVLKPKIDAEISALKADVNQLKETVSQLIQGGFTPVTSEPSSEPIDNPPAADASEYSVIFLEYGKKLFASTTTEIVLRSGTAKVISPFNEEGLTQGLNDFTTGAELLNGDEVTLNHYLLIPRGYDGRGIEITSEHGSYIIVRGGYYVESEQAQ